MTNPIHAVYQHSQSIWYDNIHRQLLDSGHIQEMIDQGEIVGITSNPTIFQKAIKGGNSYDEQIQRILRENPNVDENYLYNKLIVADIQRAADLLRGVYDKTNKRDGYISVEVSPRLAYSTEKTIEEGKELFRMIDRPNVMIKVPATTQGVPAISALLAEGINVNVTLMFSQLDFTNVSESYMQGMEQFAARGGDLSKIASVASFFISRMDSAVDKLLPEDSPCLGKTAISYAKMVYQEFVDVYQCERFRKLERQGAHVQRLLWASTSTKNPLYRDTMYVEELLGPNTVNTMPPNTLDAFRDHGKVAERVTQDLDQAHQVLEEIVRQGISLQEVTLQLKEQGVAAFLQSFDDLLQTLANKKQQILSGGRTNANTRA